MNRCDRCCGGNADKYAVRLERFDDVNDIDTTHVADVELNLCSECEEAVADELAEFKRRVASGAV